MKIVISLLVVFCVLHNVSFAGKKVKVDIGKKDVKEQCYAIKSFVMTLEFLRDHKEFSIHDKMAIKVADYVSKGCTGAGKRFINVVNILVKAGLDTNTAISTAKKFAYESDTVMKTFTSIFRTAFLGKFLDLDAFSALRMSILLSLEFDGDSKKAQKDFEKLVKFCIKELRLPLPKCGIMASKITKFGEGFDSRISGPYIKLFNFVMSSAGPNRPTYQALDIAETTMRSGPLAEKNFIKAYKYATSKKGLGLGNREALKFALNMASRTIKK